MRNKIYTRKIVIVLAIALVAFLMVNSYFTDMKKQLKLQDAVITALQQEKNNKPKEMYSYIVSVKELKAGEIITDSDVDFKQYETKDDHAFINKSSVLNKVLIKDIAVGQLLTEDYLATVTKDSSELRAGYRAITLPVNNFQGLSSTMEKGLLVDLFGTGSNSDWRMEKVKILSLEGHSKSEEVADITKAKSVTFEIAANDVAEFISNASKGRMVLVGRNQNDTKVSPKTKVKPKVENNDFGAKTLPTLPRSPEIENLGGLPEPIEPLYQPPSVELIKANQKTTITFE